MLGYSIKQLTKSEIWITSSLAVVVSMLVVQFIILGSLTDQGIDFLIYFAIGLIVSFLLPKIYYHLDINFGNILTCIAWLILMIALYAISGSNVILRVPLFVYSYLHFMRVMHYLVTGQLPTYSAHWTTIKSLDKQAGRKVSRHDLTFAVVYVVIPLIGAISRIWWNEVYGD